MIIDKVLRMVTRAKNPKQPYGGRGFNAGYHTLRLNGELYKGQRDNIVRLSKVEFDFKDKVVLDLGCNIGGMLHELAHTIKYGVGLDRDVDCINAANLIRDYNNTHNINFYNFDLINKPMMEIDDFILQDRIDICFFLSMTMWIPNWVSVVKYLKSISNNLMIELNGDDQDGQEKIMRKIYSKVSLIYDKSMDDPGQHDRRLFICNDI